MPFIPDGMNGRIRGELADFGVRFCVEQQVVTFTGAINTDGQGGDTNTSVFEGDFVRENAGQFDAGVFQGLTFAGYRDFGAAFTFQHGLNPERVTRDAAVDLRIAVGVVLQVVQFDHLDQFRTHGCPF